MVKARCGTLEAIKGTLSSLACHIDNVKRQGYRKVKGRVLRDGQ